MPIRNVTVSYIVLALAFVFEGGSWLVALRHFRRVKGPLGYYEAFRRSKDPPSFMVLFEDSAALLGIAIAALGTFASTTLHQPTLDGVAKVVIDEHIIEDGAKPLLVYREQKASA